MAQIVGVKSGFVPSASEFVSKPRQYTAVEFKCECCDGVAIIRNKRTAKATKREGYHCSGCTSLFDRPQHLGGSPEYSFQDTVDKLNKLDDNSWVMSKRDMTLNCVVTNRTLVMNAGDIFKVIRVGLKTPGDTSYQGSIKKFTIDVSFGSQSVTLFAHEFAIITWPNIMAAEKDGEIKYTFLEQEDQWGVYEPANDDIRDQLQTMLRLAR